MDQSVYRFRSACHSRYFLLLSMCGAASIYYFFFLSIRWLDAQNGSLSFLFVDFMTFGPVSDLERNFFLNIIFVFFFGRIEMGGL